MWYLLLELLWLWLRLMLVAAILGAAMGLGLRIQSSKFAAKCRVRRLRSALHHLDFVHDVVGNYGWHTGDFGKIYCDTDHTVIVAYDNSVVGMIGFEIKRSRLVIVQLQGIKGINRGDINLSQYLLKCSEDIARVLSKSYVQVCPAQSNDYYNISGERNISDHQDCLQKRYNKTPISMGYEPVAASFGRSWYTKALT